MDDSRAFPIPAEVVLSIPEIRDYRAINGELLRQLDQGCRSIRLTGAGGQRLLVARLAGPWSAVIEVVGDAGPELAAEMDAPALSIVCRGSVADGGASGLLRGRVLVLGRTGPAFGYSQRGGLAMVVGTAGCRAGLCQLAGDLILIGQVGALAGERQVGGRLLVSADLGPHAGRGRRGGRFVQVDFPNVAERGGLADHDDRAALGDGTGVVRSLAEARIPSTIVAISLDGLSNRNGHHDRAQVVSQHGGNNGMSDRGPPVAILRGPMIASLGLLLLGCAEELGPVPMPVTRVQGVVRQGRQPVSEGWIEFCPVDGTVGTIRSARLHADGSFEADRVAVGKNLVRLVNAPIESPGAARLFGSFQSPIRRQIPQRSVEPLDVDLVDEAVRFSEAQSRAVGSDSPGPGGRR